MAKTTDIEHVGAPSDQVRSAQQRNPIAATGNRQIDSIQEQIERTRDKTMRTINELGRRLSPARLIAQVRERTRQATTGRANTMANETSETTKRWGTALYDTIKSNPIPTMMVGGGLAWLIANTVRSGEEMEEGQAGFPERRRRIGTDETGTYGLGFIDRRRSSGSAVERVREEASRRTEETRSGLRRKAAEARGKASRMGEQVRDKAAETSEQIRLKAQEMGITMDEYRHRVQQRLSEGGQGAKAGFFRSLENNPLAVAGVMMAAGAAIGLMVPETRYEDEKLGPQRDEMMDRARAAGREKVEQVEAVVREAKESAKDEADRQGLVSRGTSEEAERKAEQVGEEITSKVKEKSTEMKERGSGSQE